ncbi:MAG TPA: cytochrome c [Terriglobales bacterium]
MSKWKSLELWGLLVCFVSVAVLAKSAGPEATTQDGVYSQAQADEGKKTYGEKCSSCHLESLEGGVNESPALKGDEFISHWNGKPLRALYSRILSTMPVNDPGSLEEKETLDLVAYILERNGFPAGKTEMTKPEDLSNIQFKSKK